jgi:hypothetical protein
MNKFLPLIFSIFYFGKAFAQMPTDALMMPKGQLCILAQYGQNSWENYWEGPTKRSNTNLGTFTAQNVMLMPNYGITDRLNVMAALPYVWTSADASYLDGQSGIQDLSLWLKYQILEKKALGGAFKVQAAGGASTPLTNYVADFLPFSIGFQSKTASLRGVLNYTHASGLYLTTQAGHTWRSTAKVDRDSYLYNDELIYSDEMPVPNVLDATGRLGFINKRLQVEATIDYFTGLTGDDIRYNETPQATNKMQATTAGLFAKVFVGPFAVQASAGKVLNGHNVGEGTLFAGGFTYQFGAGGKKEESK